MTAYSNIKNRIKRFRKWISDQRQTYLAITDTYPIPKRINDNTPTASPRCTKPHLSFNEKRGLGSQVMGIPFIRVKSDKCKISTEG